MLGVLDQLEVDLPQFASEVDLQRAAGPNLAGSSFG